jgi:hypothetical protein
MGRRLDATPNPDVLEIAGVIALFATVNLERLDGWDQAGLDPNVRALVARFIQTDWDKVLDTAALLQELLRLEVPKALRGDLLRGEPVFIREIPSPVQRIKEGKATAAQQQVYDQLVKAGDT